MPLANNIVVFILTINSISALVINKTTLADDSEPSDTIDVPYYSTNPYKQSNELTADEIKISYSKPEHIKANAFEHKVNVNDANKKYTKNNEQIKHGMSVANHNNAAELLSKYQDSLPYYVTKNDDIINPGDAPNVGSLPNMGSFAGSLPSNMGSIPNMAAYANIGALPGNMPVIGSIPNIGSSVPSNMGSILGAGGLASSFGAQKFNFSVNSYMKYLTKNSSLSTADVYKYVFSKKCTNNYNIICLKLDLIKILSNINNDNNQSINIIPHVMSINLNTNNTRDQQAEKAKSNEFLKNKNLYEQMILKNSYNTNYYIDNILKKKIIGLLNNMTLNIKLFDNTTIEIIRKLIHGYSAQNQNSDSLATTGGDVASGRSGDGSKDVFDGRGSAR